MLLAGLGTNVERVSVCLPKDASTSHVTRFRAIAETVRGTRTQLCQTCNRVYVQSPSHALGQRCCERSRQTNRAGSTSARLAFPLLFETFQLRCTNQRMPQGLMTRCSRTSVFLLCVFPGCDCDQLERNASARKEGFEDSVKSAPARHSLKPQWPWLQKGRSFFERLSLQAHWRPG